MSIELQKNYDPKLTEDKIYDLWEKSGYFNPDNLPKRHKEPYTIIMPPPNVTGTLHAGHAMFLTIQDIIIRYKRMLGKKTLWLPGTDHAAIATQAKVEKILHDKEDKSRYDFKREDFLNMVNEYALNSQNTILKQIRKMGSSCDWSRLAYTLDSKRSFAVNTAFKRLYELGLIYRGRRIVNWDPKMQTTVSDDEIEWKEQATPLYYLKYGPFTIATARPETKFGDKYVVMHPKDKRYANYKNGQKIKLEWINGPIEATVIKDEVIDMEFGTGVMTITPWHDITDFELAQKHNLDFEQIIDERGKLLPIAGEFEGQHIKKARALIVAKLEQKGLIEKIEENYVNRIATNSRGGGIIEPQIKEQWFVDVNKEFTIPHSEIEGVKIGELVTLKKLMRFVVESGQIEIMPKRFEKIYYHWIDGLRDWCISRQIWFGHKIPVWYKDKKIYCDTNPPKDSGWTQDADTLDTWFSSGLWTFSTLGWPEKSKDLQIFHPTQLMETAYEILFFWVARMVLMTTSLVGQIPFKTVYLHGLVRDEKREKLSKSKGDSANPLDLIDKFGTDALRFALIFNTAPGTDSILSEEKIRGMKHFANKIWNISRYILMKAPSNMDVESYNIKAVTDADKDILNSLEIMLQGVTSNLEKYQIHEAAQEIYQFAWYELADKYIEKSKPQIDDPGSSENTKEILLYCLDRIIKVLHPFMPFLTEEIYSKFKNKKDDPLMIGVWPVL